jgi:DNA-binding CsgD family transcriptional regulator/predicted negative regulator of RcsB-dependent stress response
MNQGRVQGPRLLGRASECEALDRLLTDGLAGRSRVIVLRGEAGVGKSSLLNYVSDQVAGWHVATAVGVESEMELAYSGLHQLCRPMLDHLDQLPVPQREALAVVFGQSTGPAPDRFLVGVATLTLFAEVAEQQPLVCVVDDAQWLDSASAQILGFVGRRLLAEPIVLVCAARTGSAEEVLTGLPELSINGLGDSDARALLLNNLYGPLDAAVCDQIITESHGNPLALLEFPRSWNVATLAGGFGLPASEPVVSKIGQSYVRRLRLLPDQTQLLVLAAAAEPLGDPLLLHRAAETLSIDMAAADAAVDAGLLQLGGRVEFAHPLVRSAAYRSAAVEDRHRVHRALADATDPETDSDRRAWHLARATPGPGEEVAAELERSAGRAQARGGVAAAAAFLQRAVALTADPTRRAERALAAAEASLQAGVFDAALGLLATAEAGALDDFQRARADLVRGHVAFASGLGSEAPPLLLSAGRRLEALDTELARHTYMTAWFAANQAGPVPDSHLREVSDAILALPKPVTPRPHHMLLDGLAVLAAEGLAAAAPILQQAARVIPDMSDDEVLRWGLAATEATAAMWDHEGLLAISLRLVKVVRQAGALAELPLNLYSLGVATTWIGDFAGAAALAAEADSIAAATGSHFPPYTLLRLQSLQGREAETSALIAGVIRQTAASGETMSATPAHWAASVMYNGIARYEDARAAALQATVNTLDPSVTTYALPELIEAAAREGDAQLARHALDQLAESTQPAANEFALGVEARCRALLSDGAAADDLYREAIDRLSRTQLRPDLARAHLLYGEWLRREGRRMAARKELRTAYGMFVAIGMEAFADRTRHELLATGEKVRKRSPETREELTPQEEQIARLARDGLSNPEIGAQLFLSARTVEWHLSKVFAKVGISSRRELRASLADDRRPLARV